MAQRINRLSAVKVAAAKAKGLYADGGGLYLQVSGTGSKSWIFRYKLDGRTRDMGLGSLIDVSLAQARDRAAEARRWRGQGKDPIAAREAQRAQERLDKARATTFQDCAERLIESHEVGWRNAKHRAQWRSTLATYAYPILGSLPVADIDTGLVLKVLQQPVKGEAGKKAPLWNARTETASRLRGRMEAVLSWAKAQGMRTGENPAQWRGHLENLLPARSKVQRVTHHPALPYRELPAFMAQLRHRDSITARALEFTILCAARTGETLGCRFDELDLEERLWTVPADRMKGGLEHRVPLSARAVAIAKEMAAVRVSEFVFPGAKHDKPLSNMALLMLVRELRPGITVHGFRSTFKDWCAEQTSFPDHLSEMALAHISADKVARAYQRGDLLKKRRELAEAWARYCGPVQSNVVLLRSRAR
jgi:integrase